MISPARQPVRSIALRGIVIIKVSFLLFLVRRACMIALGCLKYRAFPIYTTKLAFAIQEASFIDSLSENGAILDVLSGLH